MMKYKDIQYELQGNFIKFTHSGSRRVIGRDVYRTGTMYRSLPQRHTDADIFAKKVIDQLYKRQAADLLECNRNNMRLRSLMLNNHKKSI